MPDNIMPNESLRAYRKRQAKYVVLVQIKVEKHICEKLDKLAVENFRTRSQEARLAIYEHIKKA